MLSLIEKFMSKQQEITIKYSKIKMNNCYFFSFRMENMVNKLLINKSDVVVTEGKFWYFLVKLQRVKHGDSKYCIYFSLCFLKDLQTPKLTKSLPSVYANTCDCWTLCNFPLTCTLSGGGLHKHNRVPSQVMNQTQNLSSSSACTHSPVKLAKQSEQGVFKRWQVRVLILICWYSEWLQSFISLLNTRITFNL